MPETIRHAFGDSSLGRFLLAASEHGVVAFEFLDAPRDPLAELQERLAGVQLVHDPNGLADLLAQFAHLADKPGTVSPAPLDLRGNAYQQQVWKLLLEVPTGETTTYGALAAKLGTRDAREVTAAIASNTIAIVIPCHRVVKKDGSLSGYRWGYRRKKALLERERPAPA